MEEVGTRLAAPLFIHPNIAGRFCEGSLIGKKRTHSYNTSNQYLQNESNGWNPKDWEWDSARFVARARPNVVPLDNSEGGGVGLRVRASHDMGEENGNGLGLQLGGMGTSSGKANGGNVLSSNSAEELATSSRPNKKGRSGSPGSGGNYPVCQVDECTEDLSKAKDYHRRHKVCVVHSKVTEVLVAKKMQRFCQQCSRFHPLAEFDEGKRSCRRRLAGHNRRRRKTQPEDATSLVVHPTNSNNACNGNLDIVNLLTVLARAQGNAEMTVSNCPSLSDKNQLIEVLSKLNSLPRPTGPAIPSGPTQNSLEEAVLGRNNMDVNPAAKSNSNLLAALSATFVASAPDVSGDKSKASFGYKNTSSDVCNKPTKDQQSLWGGERSSSSYQSPTEDSEGQLQDTRVHLPLQLFSPSPGDDSPPNMVSPQKYFSSDSSSPPEVRSHPSSVPITRTLFPLETTSENDKPDRMSICEEANVNIQAGQTGTFASEMTLDLFSLGNRAVCNTLQNLPPHQVGYTSSGSDHSPPSFNSDPQKDRTGRIMFKLFDKDPSHFPGSLRTQIYNWLSNSPSEMESFIRPGCVVLSIYVSMPSAAWEKLEENFAQQASNLVQGSDSEFWRSGRFSVTIGRHLAFHKDGKFNLCKPWSTPNSAELVAVSPLAVVSGQCTSFVIRGRNLTLPGTKIYCTSMGGNASKEVLGSTYQEFNYDEIRLSDFKVHAAGSVIGRFFIEVENGVRGHCFPIIVADAKICQELRLLEHEFDPNQNISSHGSHAEILCFLNELGWLFQRQISSDVAIHDFVPHRFQSLLTFSIERDYCAVVKTLLDIFVGQDSKINGLSTECVEALAKMHLLHRAVKKKSKKMVEMLIHYSVPYDNGASQRYVFPPNLRGPGGITPLHLAACTSGSYDIVDILTDDPTETGLRGWKTLLDDNGQSPSAYAIMRNDHPLNSLVAQKLVDRKNSQVSVSIGNEITESPVLAEVRQRSSLQLNKKPDSCSKCAMITYNRMPGRRGMPHRPFIHSMLAIAAVCVCVCLFFKSMSVPLTWENLDFGSM